MSASAAPRSAPHDSDSDSSEYVASDTSDSEGSQAPADEANDSDLEEHRRKRKADAADAPRSKRVGSAAKPAPAATDAAVSSPAVSAKVAQLWAELKAEESAACRPVPPAATALARTEPSAAIPAASVAPCTAVGSSQTAAPAARTPSAPATSASAASAPPPSVPSQPQQQQQQQQQQESEQQVTKLQGSKVVVEDAGLGARLGMTLQRGRKSAAGGSGSASGPARSAPAASGPNSKKPTILEQSRMRWDEFKQQTGLTDELRQAARDGFLEKQAFLQRVDVRTWEYELELKNKAKKGGTAGTATDPPSKP